MRARRLRSVRAPLDDLRSALLHTLGGAIERRGVRRADTTLVYTQRLAELLDGHGSGAAVRVIRRGVDPEPFARARERRGRGAGGGRDVVFVGRLVKAKGVATLVEAAARVRTLGVRFALVGDGPERGKVERRARALGVADRVRVTGFVAHGRVRSLMADADLLVLPSYYEELGTVLIEALHAGLPVVASAVGGIPEVVEDGVTGLLVPAGDAAALARAIDSIVADRELAGRMGAEALRRAPAYDLSTVCSEIHELYRDLARERESSAAPVLEPPAVPASGLASSRAVVR